MDKPESVPLAQAEGGADEEVKTATAGYKEAAEAVKEERDAYKHSNPEGQIRQQTLELGWIGRVFGGGKEKAGNIAVTAIMLGFVLVIAIVIADSLADKNIPYSQVIVTGGVGIITASLGYVYGVNKSSN